MNALAGVHGVFPFPMKVLSSCALVAAVLLLGLRPVQAERLFGLDDSWMEEQITAPADALPIDEAFAALSRAASINSFVDATHLPVGQIIQPYAKRPKTIYYIDGSSRDAVISNVVKQTKTTLDRTAKDTFVFWREPDVNRVVNLIVAHQKQLNALHLPADDKTTIAALEQFFARTQDWPTQSIKYADQKRRAQGLGKAVTLSELPPELQAPLRAEFVRRLRQPGADPGYSEFEMQSWQNGRVRLVEEQVNRDDEAGRYLGTQKALVVKIYFSPGRYPFWVGPPHWATPNQVELTDFVLPSFLNEPERLSQFEAAQDVQATPPGPDLPALDFKEDAFQRMVKFAGKCSDLRAFVSELSKQSGQTLSVAPDVLPGAKILAASPGMTLGAALAAVEHLYCARWVKAAPGYQLQSRKLEELHQNLVQLGIRTLYEWFSYKGEERQAMGRQIADEVTGNFDWAQLKTEQGAPFSELPLEVQSHIMDLFRIDEGSRFIVNQQRLDDALTQAANFFIHLSKVPEHTPQFFGAFRSQPSDLRVTSLGATSLSAFSPDGRYITGLFPQFRIYPPLPSGEQDEAQLEAANAAAQAAYDAQNPKP